MKFISLLFGLLLVGTPALAADTASPDETAKFLAGLPVPSTSPLAPLTNEASWKNHAAFFDTAFKRFDDRQRSKIQRWSKQYISMSRPTLFYMFSGPDYLHANAFFPDETTYILSGLEPPGPVPDVVKLPKAAVTGGLNNLQRSLRSILNVNFFITNNMASELRATSLNGTIPILYVFLARSGKTISDVTAIHLTDDGEVHTDGKGPPNAPQGVKITFSSPGGPAQTLYYFGTNIVNGQFAKNGFSKFCEKFGEGVALVKSASYLLHGNNFSEVRAFLMKNSAAIVQDDTGVPVRMFDAGWQVRAFGNYAGPIGIFAGNYQSKLAELHKKEHVPLDFGLGYKWRPDQSSLLLAVKAGAPAAPPPPVTPAAMRPSAPATAAPMPTAAPAPVTPTAPAPTPAVVAPSAVPAPVAPAAPTPTVPAAPR